MTSPTQTDAPQASRPQPPVTATGSTSDGLQPMRPGRAATGPGPAPVVAIVLAVALLASAVVLLREALVVFGAVGGAQWLPAAARSLPVVAPSTVMVVVGVALVLVGVWLAYLALRRRTRKAVQVSAGTGVFTTPADVARLSSSTARDVDGVLSARSTATHRTVTVRISTTGDPTTTDAVRSMVTGRLSVLERAPKVRVNASTDSTGRSR